MNRFVVFQLNDEWLVTYGDRTQVSYTTREQAEQSAFDAADAMASSGHAVSVLIMPNGLEASVNRSGAGSYMQIRGDHARICASP